MSDASTATLSPELPASDGPGANAAAATTQQRSASPRRAVPGVGLSRAARKELRQALRDAGCFDRERVHAWVFFITMASLGLLTSAAIVFAPVLAETTPALSWLGALGPWRYLLAPVAAFFLTVAAMLGHEGGHMALSDSAFENRLFASLAFAWLAGMSAGYWMHKHNGLHHPHPNDPDLDPDVKILPMAASAETHASSPKALQWFQRNLQWWAFWLVATQLHLAMRRTGTRHLYRQIKAGKYEAVFRLDAMGLVFHIATWLVLPALVVGLGPTLGAYMLIWSFVGLYLTIIFAPAHMGLPLVDKTGAKALDGWELQLQTTRNIRLPGWLAWAYCGLDHQIEHHLFPRISHRKLGKAAEITRTWANEHGLPYRDVGFLEGIADVSRYLSRSWAEPRTDYFLDELV
jgi:fatty acid desaturase